MSTTSTPGTDPSPRDPSHRRRRTDGTSSGITAGDWQELVAVGLVARDLAPAAIARITGGDVATVVAALDQAQAEGVIAADGTVDARTEARLVALLPASTIAAIHAAAARRVLSGSERDLRRGYEHLREAVAAMPSEELVDLAERAGRFALDAAEVEVARDLLLLALEHDLGEDLVREAACNLDLSRALSLLGDSTAAQARLMRAVLLAEECGAADLATQAAVRFALPADWQAGDSRVVGMVERVQRMPSLNDEQRTQLLATRAWVEARLPVAQAEGQQVSWIGRPGVARPLAVEALAASASQSDRTRLLALLAWRHTHRGPQFLAERREVATEAVTVAERSGASAELVEAAVLLAADALEDGDRAAHRVALTTAAAVADRSGDARLRWRALVPAAAAALMEDDVAGARALAGRAFVAGETSGAPGLLASRWTFTGQLATLHADPTAIEASFTADPAVLATSPLGRAGLALLLARRGSRSDAAAHAHGTLHQLDEESSLLLTLSRLADAAIALDDPELAEEVAALLAPWSGRVVVDANSWWCDGPVDLWLAELMLLRRGVTGSDTRERGIGAERLLDAAARLAQATGDIRSLRRIAEIRDRVPAARAVTGLKGVDLTPRELEVLRGLAAGETYTRIAADLRYSVSTVRNDAVAIYRKLGVRGRSEAAARAVDLGLRLRRSAR